MKSLEKSLVAKVRRRRTSKTLMKNGKDIGVRKRFIKEVDEQLVLGR